MIVQKNHNSDFNQTASRAPEPPVPSPQLPIPSSAFGLRTQLFLSSALLSSAILVVAAWVINDQVVGQAREQVQAEVSTLLPLYDAILEERMRRLATLGATMAASPIVKTVFGDERAARDERTLHELIADVSHEEAELDLVLLSDGAGRVIHADRRGTDFTQLQQLEAARFASEQQQPAQSFTVLDDKLFQLALTPVLLQSGQAELKNTLAVFGAGFELNHRFAEEIKERTHSDLIFFIGGRPYVSSFAPAWETQAVQAVAAADLSSAVPEHPAELNIGDTLYLAFARPMTDHAGQRLGQIVILRSLASAGQFFRAISNRLLLLWTLGVVLAWWLSYLLAERIARPLAVLAAGARELGQGNPTYPVPVQARGEIGELARAFDQMRRSLQQSQTALLKSERLATIGQMSSSIIHDLRNPLAAITTAAEVLNKDSLPPERRRTLLANQLRAAERMSEMLRELLEFSQGRYQLRRERHALAALVARAAQDLAEPLARANVVFTAQIPPEILVEADDERLRRVFENLFSNALQAMPQGGALTVRAATQENRVRINVSDNGPGVPAQLRERLFEPFVSHGKQGGTGLGLAIAHGVITAHGGAIGLVETAEPGAHFFIELPQADAAFAAGAESI